MKQRYFPKDIDTCLLNKQLDKTWNEADNDLRRKKGDFPKILSEIEQLNVDVPMNRNKFRQFYLKNIMELMKDDDDIPWQNKN